MSRRFPPRYYLASLLLLLGLVGLYAVTTTRRTQRELARQLEEKGLALAEAFETTSRNAIRGNALMEEMIAQRLLDNVRLIDRLLLSRPLDPAAVAEIAAANRLRRIDLLDRDGRPYTFPAPPRGIPGMMMPGRPGGEIPEAHRSFMMFMWGRRWGQPPGGEAGSIQGPAVIHERKFWEGSLFGVALGAQSFPGIIAVHADADYVLNFRKEIGVEAQVEELGRQSGVAEVALFSPDLTILAHSDPRRIGQREEGDDLKRVLGEGKGVSHIATREGRDVFKIVRSVALDGSRVGLLRIGLATDTMTEAWQRDFRSAILLGLAVLLVGALGLGFIFYIQARHLTEVRRLETEVERRERLSVLGNLAAIVGHEVRNPLNAISMGLQRLRREFRPQGEPEEYTRMMELMQGEVKRLNGIVEEFLSLARPVPLKLESVRVEELLREVATLVGADAEHRRVHLSVRIPADLPEVRLDPNYLKQVLLNLVMNGLEAMPHGGALTLGALASRNSVTVTVEDTGQGIAPDLLPTIFEPYVTTKTKGMGLGLAIARKIVEAHGGRIDVGSRPGEGTRFAITLPLNPPAVGFHG